MEKIKNDSLIVPIYCLREECTINVEIGNQNFKMLIDLYSPMSWVSVENCSLPCNYITKYDLINNIQYRTKSDILDQIIMGYRDVRLYIYIYIYREAHIRLRVQYIGIDSL